MMRVLTTQQMRRLEQAAEADGVSDAHPHGARRPRRGLLRLAKHAHRRRRPGPRRPRRQRRRRPRRGAHASSDWGAHVELYLCTPRTPDALLARAVASGAHAVDATDDADGARLRQSLRSADLVIDAVLGTGRSRPLAEPLRSIFEAVRAEKARRPHLHVLAVDVPSGVDADTGDADPASVTADATVTLGAPKTGHFRFPAADRVGQLVVSRHRHPPPGPRRSGPAAS